MIQDGTQDFYNQQAELARQYRLQRPPTTMSATEKIAASAEPQSAESQNYQKTGAPAAPQPAPAPLTREQIREVFMANGFTIKEGQTDLKQYVYDAAYALLGLVATPPAEQQARWVERWHGSGGKEFWEGWSILNAANREMIAHLGPDVDPGVVRGIVTAHNDALCGECAGTGGRWCPACAGATPSAEQQAAPKAAPGDRPISSASAKAAAHVAREFREAAPQQSTTKAAPQQEAQEAAPRESLDECFPGESRVAVPQGLIGAACFAIRKKRDGGKVLEQLRRYSVGDLSQPLAPQQEAQEPVAWQGAHDPTDLYYTKPLQADVRPLYTAPQAAPAPLSDDTERLEWLLWKLPGDALRYVVGELSDTSSGAEFRAAIDAARKQGGRDAG